MLKSHMSGNYDSELAVGDEKRALVLNRLGGGSLSKATLKSLEKMYTILCTFLERTYRL